MQRIFNQTEQAVIRSYLSFCKQILNKDKYAKNENFYRNFSTDKAIFIRLPIVDLREFSPVTGERIHPEGTFNSDTYVYFWCPQKIMGWDKKTIPYWFIMKKLDEQLEQNGYMF